MSSGTFLPCRRRSAPGGNSRRSMGRVETASFFMTKLLTSAAANDSSVRSLAPTEFPFAPPRCKTRAWHPRNHNLEYMARYRRARVATYRKEKLRRVHSPRSLEAEGKVRLFAGATNVTANEGPFQLLISENFPSKSPFEVLREQKKIGTSGA